MIERRALATFGVGLIVPLAAVTASAARLPSMAAWGIACALLLFIPAVARRLPATLDGLARRHRVATLLFVVVAVAALVQTTRLARFMIEPARPEASIMPWDTFFRTHSCLSAYVVAAERNRDGVANVYELPDAVSDRYERAYAPLLVDDYLYPPTFLWQPRLALALGAGFFTIRMLWFVIEALLLGFAVLCVARFIGGDEGRRAALLSPLFWAATPTLLSMQIGNYQVVAFSLAMLSLVAVESGHDSVGGFLLASVTLSKVFPGVLVLVLLVRGRWRALAWTAGFAIAIAGVSLMLVGRPVFDAFIHHELPRLSHADRFFDSVGADQALRFAAINFSVHGAVSKLRVLGVSMSPAAADATSLAFTCVLVVAALATARARSRLALVEVTMAVLVLAAMRSPFLPSAYATVGALWLLTAVGAEGAWWWPVPLIIGLSYVVPDRHVGLPSPPWRVVIGTMQQIAVVGVALAVLGRAALRQFSAPSARSR
jgi:hypothetical protein